jgi:hypothetical protein
MSLKCYEGKYYLFAYGAAFPGIVVWGLGIPFFAFAVLLR